MPTRVPVSSSTLTELGVLKRHGDKAAEASLAAYQNNIALFAATGVIIWNPDGEDCCITWDDVMTEVAQSEGPLEIRLIGYCEVLAGTWNMKGSSFSTVLGADLCIHSGATLVDAFSFTGPISIYVHTDVAPAFTFSSNDWNIAVLSDLAIMYPCLTGSNPVFYVAPEGVLELRFENTPGWSPDGDPTPFVGLDVAGAALIFEQEGPVVPCFFSGNLGNFVVSEDDSAAFVLMTEGWPGDFSIPDGFGGIFMRSPSTTNGGSGSSSQRPWGPWGTPIGTAYYDTTLNKPIWYNGDSWVDVSNTPV